MKLIKPHFITEMKQSPMASLLLNQIIPFSPPLVDLTGGKWYANHFLLFKNALCPEFLTFSWSLPLYLLSSLFKRPILLDPLRNWFPNIFIVTMGGNIFFESQICILKHIYTICWNNTSYVQTYSDNFYIIKNNVGHNSSY